MESQNGKLEANYARVFFALFPNLATQKQLALRADKLTVQCGGRKIKMQHIHLTLVFLGNIDIIRLENLKQSMQPITAKPFQLLLDTVCYWKHTQIVSLQPSQPCNELLELVNKLEIALTNAQFTYDKRPYKPHITLIRKATHPPQTNTIEPILFDVMQWVLVQSKPIHNQIEYIPLARWNLA